MEKPTPVTEKPQIIDEIFNALSLCPLDYYFIALKAIERVAMRTDEIGYCRQAIEQVNLITNKAYYAAGTEKARKALFDASEALRKRIERQAGKIALGQLYLGKPIAE